jgi:L-fuculose-phosphate aldolase
MAGVSPAAPAPRPDEARLRESIVAAGRRLGARGLISASEGNLSVRLDAASLLITPAGLRKDELRVDELLVVPIAAGGPVTDPAGAARGLRASSDIAIHRAVYRARSEVLAVVHAHLPASLALTVAGSEPDPAVLPETAHFIPRLPFVPFGEMGSDELAGRIATALAELPMPLPGAVLLERHGAVAVGGQARAPMPPPAEGGDTEEGAATGAEPATDWSVQAIAEAVNRLELVEVLCRTWRDALLVRAAVLATGPEAILPAPEPSPRMPARGRSTQP